MKATLLFAAVAATTEAALGHPKVCGYRPATLIVDELMLDLDVLKIKERLTEGQLVHARNVYERGGHSMSAAVLTLLDPPASYEYPANTAVYGLSKVGGREVSGFLPSEIKWGEGEQNETVRVQYAISYANKTSSGCHVGGLYTFGQDTLDGCFHDGVGTVEFVVPGHNKGTGELFPYTYNIRQGNVNLRTLQGLSSRAGAKMRPCPSCPYFHDFQKYVDYYGQEDYGDKWVMTAVSGGETNFSTARGDANYNGYTKLGRAEGMLHGVITLNTFMQVIRELEESVQRCHALCTNKVCSGNQHLNALDKAAAFFCGSLPGEDGSGDGLLLYSLAQRRHSEFHPPPTLADEDRDVHGTGDGIIGRFRQAQLALLEGDCTTAGKQKTAIVNLMKLPLIQSVLRYAYVRDQKLFDADLEEEKAVSFGATYAAALLPFVHVCDEKDAQIVYESMRFGSETSISFAGIKTALERQYRCMHVDCDAVGGLWTERGYAEGASPCANASLFEVERSSDRGGGRVLFGVILVAVVIAALGIWLNKRRPHRFRRQGSPFGYVPSSGANIAAVSDIA